MMALTIATWQADKQEQKTEVGLAQVLLQLCFYLYLILFWSAVFGRHMVVPTEVSSLQLRAATAALSTSCNWLFNFMVVCIKFSFSCSRFKFQHTNVF